MKAIHSNTPLRLLDIDMQEWIHFMSIYHDANQRVGARIVNDFNICPAATAGILINVIDAIIDKVPDMHQIPFEQKVLEIFNQGVSQRHEYTGKEKFTDDNH